MDALQTTETRTHAELRDAMDARQTARAHTLAELRETGRAGWTYGYLFAEGRVFRIVAVPTPAGANVVHIRPTSLKDEDSLLRDGWSLLPQQ